MSAKSLLFQALINDIGVTNRVGFDSNNNPKIYQSWHDSKRGYPQITITRVAESGESHGDNETEVLATIMQIDIWTNNSPTNLEDAVKLAVYNNIPSNQRSKTRSILDEYESQDKLYRVTLQTIIYEVQ
ncbi:MAG: hypothetical protein FH761_16610 [Firmicutes bacterium]|nr:hypothetical protein [Bacillota bacterium]